MTKDATSTLDSLFQQLIKEVKTHGSKITKGFKVRIGDVMGVRL